MNLTSFGDKNQEIYSLESIHYYLFLHVVHVIGKPIHCYQIMSLVV